MGYATAEWPCGCSHTQLMGGGPTIRYYRCAEHYKPEEDDPKIVEAAKNYREHIRRIRESESHERGNG